MNETWQWITTGAALAGAIIAVTATTVVVRRVRRDKKWWRG